MKIFKKISIHLFVFSFLIIPICIYAQEQQTTPPTEIKIDIPNPLADKKADSLISLITILLNNVVMPMAAVAVVIWIIWAGFQYLLAQGKPEALKKAHSQLLWSLIGAGVLLGAAGIAKVVENTINGLINTN